MKNSEVVTKEMLEASLEILKGMAEKHHAEKTKKDISVIKDAYMNLAGLDSSQILMIINLLLPILPLDDVSFISSQAGQLAAVRMTDFFKGMSRN